MDYIIVGGYTSIGPTNQVLRYYSSFDQVLVVISSAPWPPRYNTRIAYAGNTLVMCNSEDYDDVWISNDDGFTWKVRIRAHIAIRESNL